jgi:hypothetical protein
MNSLLNRSFIALMVLVATLQSAGQTQEIVELKRADGGSVLGMSKDATHFVTCRGNEIKIATGDKISTTDKTCQSETNGFRCALCAYHPGEGAFSGTTQAPIVSVTDQTPGNNKTTQGVAPPSTSAKKNRYEPDQNATARTTSEAAPKTKRDSTNTDKADTAAKKAKTESKKQQIDQKQ